MSDTLERVEVEPGARGSLLADLLSFGLVLALVSALTVGFAIPWRTASTGAGTDLARFGGASSGDAWTLVVEDADGTVTSWETGHTVVQAGFQAIINWRDEPSQVLRSIVDPDGSSSTSALTRALRDVEAHEIRTRTLADGDTTDATTYVVLTASAQLLVGLRDDEQQVDSMFEPPIVLLQPDLSVGTRWSSEGIFRSAFQYTSRREVLERGPFESPLGKHDDCVLIEDELVITDAEQEIHRGLTNERSCAGLGIVESLTLDPDSRDVTSRRLVVASRDGVVDTERLPDIPAAPALADATATPAGHADWAWTRMGRIRNADEATIPPVHLALDQPLVLVAARDQDLTAMAADGPGQDPIWRFNVGGTVHAPPAVDHDTGMIYVGSTGRRLYAIDTRGFFHWSYATDDAVTGGAVLLDDVVVFGSEDGHVYGLDAATGQERWVVDTGGPVASTGAVAGDLVVIGSDDGVVRAIDGAGRVVWSSEVDGAVVGPLVTDGATVWVGTDGGDVLALDAQSGEFVWDAGAEWGVLSRPAVSDDAVVVVDDGGVVQSFDRATGKRLWRRALEASGYPVVLDDGTIAVATRSGTVELLDPADGTSIASFHADEARGVSDDVPDFQLGPSAGGGALWVIDESTVLRRLGAPATAGGDGVETTALQPSALVTPQEAPWTTGDVPSSTPLDYDGRALLLENSGKVFVFDPTSGATELLGAVPLDGGSPFAGGTLAGDRLLFNAQERLFAVDLPGVEVAWTFDGQPIGARPPVVAGDTVLWVSGQAMDDASVPTVPTLYAIDLVTGELRWSAELPDTLPLAGVVERDGVVYSSSGAFDLATGDQRWATSLDLPGAGSPALSEDGTVLFVDLASEVDADNGLAALDAGDGALLWRTTTTAGGLSPLEAFWVEGGIVVVPSVTGAIVGVDAATGDEMWSFTPPQPSLGTITVDQSGVWLMTDTGSVYVLDAATGSVRHRFTDLDVALHHYARGQRPGRVGDHMVVAGGFFVLAFEIPEGAS